MTDKELLSRFANERLLEKGGERFTKLNAADVRYLFNLYDEIVFGGQISQRLTSQSSTLSFKVDTGIDGSVGEIEVADNVYTLTIAPRILLKLERSSKNSRLEWLSYTIKHQLLHLCILLWNYYTRTPPSVFSTYGSLFKCMMEEYFPGSPVDIILDTIVFAEPYLDIVDPKPLGGFSNWENSCYIDSVLMVLFECASEWWRRNMLERLPSPDDEFKGVCDISGGSEITTAEELYKLRLDVRTQLLSDYEQINDNGEVIQCVDLREMLRKCLPSLQEDGLWSLFNTGAFYDLLVSLFPAVQLTIPIEVVLWDDQRQVHVPQPIENKKLAAIPMWDFMDPHTDIENSGYERILWNSPALTSEVLVFINGAVPRVKVFNRSGKEKGFFYINGTRTVYDVVKARAFDYNILNGKYRLVGVVTLQGISSTQEGGSHYISYFLSTDDKWYRYNDLTASATALEILPINGVWEEKGGEMPAMYFYERTS